MKKLNKSRQTLLQKKRTKRNQSRKGVKYNAEKLVNKAQKTLQASTPSSVTGDTTFVI